MRFLLLPVAVVLLLSGCGGDSEASSGDAELCAQQATDLADVRTLVGELTAEDSHWGPGGPAAAIGTAGEGVEALTGYVPDGEKVTRAVDKALDALQALHDDLEDDETLSGTGQTAKTAAAALEALDTACG